MAAAMVTKKMLESRLSPLTVQRIFDDNNDGQADTDPVNQLLADASGMIRGGLPGYNPDDLSPANALLTDELRRLTLDAAVAMAAQRHPTVMKRDWEPLMKFVMENLELIRKSQRTLGSNSAPTPSDQSISVASATPTGSSFWP